MIVTNGLITGTESNNGGCLLAFADVELDQTLVIHGLRIIQRTPNIVFVDFPSRPAPAAAKCAKCSRRLDCTARYCSFCGEHAATLEEPRYKNVVHPINVPGRRMIHDAVMQAYRKYKSFRQDQNVAVEPSILDVESRYDEVEAS